MGRRPAGLWRGLNSRKLEVSAVVCGFIVVGMYWCDGELAGWLVYG